MKQFFIALAVTAAFVAVGGEEGFSGSERFSDTVIREHRVEAQVLAVSNVQETETLYRLGRSVTYENVTVYPIIYGGQKQQQRVDYATLGEAMQNGWIEIVEMPEGGRVSTVTIRYTGTKPLILLAGDLLLGGKQDRVVAEDTVVEPRSTVVVKVYCVERGRWSGPTMSFGYAGTQVPTNVKEQAILAGQSEVWGRTSGFNALAARADGLRRAASTGGGGGGAAFAGVRPGGGGTTVDAGLKVESVVEFTKIGKAELISVLESESSVVGVIFVINGEIRLMELFGEPSLLAVSFDPILGGVLALAAVTHSDEWKLPTEEKLNVFLHAAIEAQDASSNSFLTGVGGTAKKVTGPGVRGSVIGGAGKEGGTATHGSYFPLRQGSESRAGGGRSGGGVGIAGGGGGAARSY